MPVVNMVKDLLLLIISTYIDLPNIETLAINTVKDLLLLATSTYIDPLVIEITFTVGSYLFIYHVHKARDLRETRIYTSDTTLAN